MISEFVHIFICLLAICMSWKNVSLGPLLLFKLSCSFFDIMWIFIYFGCQHLIKYITCRYILPVNRILYCFVVDFLLYKKIFRMVSSHLFVSLLRRHIKKKFLRLMSKRLLPMFSSRSFMVSHLTVKSIIHFEFFVRGVRKWSSSIPLHVAVQFHNIIYWRSCLFSIVYFSLHFCRLTDCMSMGLLVGTLLCSINLPVPYYSDF